MENKAGQKLLFSDFAKKYECYEIVIVIFKLVGFCRPCAGLTRHFKLINTKTVPPIAASLILPAIIMKHIHYTVEKNLRKSKLEGKSAKVRYCSFIVIQFNNATAGGICES